MNEASLEKELAALNERVNFLIQTFNKFEEKHDRLFTRLLEYERNVNDLSHLVKGHEEFIEDYGRREEKKAELSGKWKLTLISTLATGVISVLLELVKRWPL